MAFKWLIIIVLFIIGIMLISLSFRGEEGSVEPLGIFGGETKIGPCTGELSVTSKDLGDKCHLEASLVMRNCEGKRWYVFNGNSCEGGILVCQGNSNEPESIWKCAWDSNKGSYTFTLCADTEFKTSANVVC